VPPIAAEAERILRAALELRPRDSRVAHALGLLDDDHPAWTEAGGGYRAKQPLLRNKIESAARRPVTM
jgi:coenzyme F420-reducing hydrogenase alpha subunit